MDVSPNALRKETVQLLAQINTQIATVKLVAKERGVEPHQIMDPSGQYLLSPLLLAKAQCLHTLTLLNEQGRRR